MQIRGCHALAMLANTPSIAVEIKAAGGSECVTFAQRTYRDRALHSDLQVAFCLFKGI